MILFLLLLESIQSVQILGLLYRKCGIEDVLWKDTCALARKLREFKNTDTL